MMASYCKKVYQESPFFPTSRAFLFVSGNLGINLTLKAIKNNYEFKFTIQRCLEIW